MIEVDSQIRMIIANLNDKLEAITHECSVDNAYAGYIDEKLKSIEWDIKVLRHRVNTAMNKDKGEKNE